MNHSERKRQFSVLPICLDSQYRGAKKWFVGLIMGFVGFLLTSQFISNNFSSTTVPLELPLADQKLDAIEAIDAKYNVLFLGTSRTLRGVNPMVLDSEAKKYGCHIRAFNFGIHGLSLLEQSFLIDRIAESGKSFKTIVIEPYSVPDRRLNQFISGRRRYFYNWSNIADIFIDHFTMPHVRGPRRCLTDTICIATGFIYEQSGVGRITNFIFPAASPKKGYKPTEISTGFIPKNGYLGGKGGSINQRYLEKVDRFMQVQKTAAEKASVRHKVDFRYDLVVGIVDKIRRLNIEPVILIMPQIEFYDSKCLAEKITTSCGKTLSVLNFNSPSDYPELFKCENRSDIAHLNRQGSTVMSKLLAPKLCSIQCED